MSLQVLHNVTATIVHLFGGLNTTPLAVMLVGVGIALLLAILIGAIIYGAIRAFKAIPSMTTKEFIAFIALLAVFLILLGLIIP